ncbi:MAG: glucan biosynthesis protein [Deltaproteobacteria bacterium]|nr:glucan biosynthesis protein [Deltaproteobacteria bacterium]
MHTSREFSRRFVTLATCSALIATIASTARAEGHPDVAVAFSSEWLRSEAKHRAALPYDTPSARLPDWIENLDWDGYQSIKFRADQSLWRGKRRNLEVRFFHLGLFFKHPVTIHEVDESSARVIPYSNELFTYGPSVRVPEHQENLGFAGFRVGIAPDVDADVFAFLGASYFRGVGATKQYGLSARGLAVDTAMPRPEEFPDFREFWLEKPSAKSRTLVLHALLDSPSVTGAYTFVVSPGETTVMDVDATLYPRKPIERVGVAPLTSMYQCGENDRRVCDDFRPEIHDSDGLMIRNGLGESIWRPLINSPVLRVNSFLDDNPKGFGLMQRDQVFDHYQDDGAMYHKRPSLWVEPLDGWGKGQIQLVEIPGGDETADNIVVFWNPAEPFGPGQERRFRYRLSWGSKVPVPSPMATVVSTRAGAGGIPGQKNRPHSRKFVIDFKGGRFEHMPWETKVEPVITVSRGQVLTPAVRPVIGGDTWRCNFDLLADGEEPIDMRLYLRDAGGALTETWLYQYTP